MVLTNDENMQNVWVYDWGQADARLLFINFVQSLLASGKVDGLFADKWGTHCQQVYEMIRFNLLFILHKFKTILIVG